MDFNLFFAKLQFGAPARLRAYQKIAVMLTNKIGIGEILDELYERESKGGEKPGEAMAVIYNEWRNCIRNGGRFCDALEGWVPVSERMIAMAGEGSGNLPKALHSIIAIVTAGKSIRSAVTGGLAYPLVLLAATLGYLFLFGMHVIPEFTRILDVRSWGKLAYSLYQMSEFVVHYGVLLLVAIAALIGLIALSMSRWCGTVRVYFDRVPPWSLYRLVVGSGFMFSLGALMSSGGRIQDALRHLLAHSNPYLAERIDAFLFGINSGLNAGDAIRDSGYDFPSKEIVGDLGIYAKYSGDFSVAIEMIASEWMHSGLDTVRAQMKVLFGISIAFMAAILAWIVSGFFAIQQEIAHLSRAMGGGG